MQKAFESNDLTIRSPLIWPNVCYPASRPDHIQAAWCGQASNGQIYGPTHLFEIKFNACRSVGKTQVCKFINFGLQARAAQCYPASHLVSSSFWVRIKFVQVACDSKWFQMIWSKLLEILNFESSFYLRRSWSSLAHRPERSNSRFKASFVNLLEPFLCHKINLLMFTKPIHLDDASLSLSASRI